MTVDSTTMTARFPQEPQPTGEIARQVLGQGRADDDSPPRWARWLLFAVGLVALSGVWLLLVMRWRAVTHPATIAIVGVMPLLAIAPLVVALLSSWWSRSNTLRAAAAVTVGAFVFTTSPVDAIIGCRADDRATSADSNVFTIYTANVWFESPGGQPDQIAAAIAAEDPDILFLQEVQPDFLQAIEADQRLNGLAHRSTDLVGGRDQDLVWSRWPLTDLGATALENTRLIQIMVDSPAGAFTVSPIHLQAPVKRGDAALWNRQLQTLRMVDQAAPRILAGDFNATRDHQGFRSLLDAGWTDVHEHKGCGFDATWPVGQRLPFPIMRLDHVLITDHFEVLDVRLGDPGGSDHLPVITTLQLGDQT